MTQSVELLLDGAAEAVVVGEWARLAEAGLPSEQRTVASRTHRPHITMWAGSSIDPEVDVALPVLVGTLDLRVRLGSLLLFGPRRGLVVVVRQVVASAELLALQSLVAQRCGVEPGGHFAPGAWSPHVTVARRVGVDQLSAVVAALAPVPELDALVSGCRRWDGDAKVAWDIAGGDVPPRDHR